MLGLLCAAPSAHAAVFVAYGEGLTHCRIETVRHTQRALIGFSRQEQTFSGKTDCSVPIEQSVHAVIPSAAFADAIDGGVCSAVATSCFSGQSSVKSPNGNPMTLTLYLRAPLGEGWLGAPTGCSGVGTDNLRCEFTIESDLDWNT